MGNNGNNDMKFSDFQRSFTEQIKSDCNGPINPFQDVAVGNPLWSMGSLKFEVSFIYNAVLDTAFLPLFCNIINWQMQFNEIRWS